ncbi:Beta-galactosidase [Cucumis melo var. makuwa]|uniref:Beta-galactosidase n=1 Tax=Cucumis melo var. makuwa TaxID=1194695 RepID=A0A5A7T3J8_CUCMM|nr:Beta-galactosidase [Cucumis melo var. makuwa]TYK18987.1 Beta-galactosidase [Cucumis melo var. makuwa]
MVSEQGKDDTLDTVINETKKETAAAATAAVVVVGKLLQQLQKMPVVTTGASSESSAQHSGQNPPHAPSLSCVWAHVPPSNHLTTQPIVSHVSFPVQPIIQIHSRSSFEVDESSTQSKSTNLPMSLKNSVTSVPNFPSNYITDSAAFSAQFSTHGGKKRSSNEQQNSGRVDVTDLTASQTSPPTLSFIAQSGSSDHCLLLAPLCCDVWGPSKVIATSGKWWFVTFINDHTRLTWVYLITNQSEVSSISQNIYHTIETQFHTKIAILWSDNGWEFQNHSLGEFLASKSIVYQSSCTYTPLQNGVAERRNCHLPKVAHSLMLLSTSLPSYLWGDTILTAAYLINRMPSRILHIQTPLDCLKEFYPFTRLISEVLLRVSRCTTYVHNFDPNQTKFNPRAQACVFVGYPLHRRNLIKEVKTPTSQQTPVQDSEPPQDQGVENPTESCTDNKMSENDKSDVVVLENVEEKDSGNKTEEIYALPKGHKIVGYKLVFTLKYKAVRTLDRHKTRPSGGSLHDPPPEFEAQFGQQVCKLQKSLYGQVPTFVKSQGYSQGHSDHTLFTKVSKAGKIVVLIVYVDGIGLSGDDQVCWDVILLTSLLNSTENWETLVIKLHQFMQAPYEEHVEVVNIILRYLKMASCKGNLPPVIVPMYEANL